MATSPVQSRAEGVPARGEAAAASRVPMNANATATEQISRYFHIASSDSRETCSEIRKAVSSVVASMPTHISPTLFETSSSVMVARAPHQSPPKTRAWRFARPPCAISAPR